METKIAYQPPFYDGVGHVERQNVRRAQGVEQKLAHDYACRLNIPPEKASLRADMVSPNTYQDYVPKLLTKMESLDGFTAAADRICEAIKSGKKIGISADYDCDGNTSAAVFIRMLHMCGVPREHIEIHIPNREAEGYGVNSSAVDAFKKKDVGMMITLDNGTMAHGPLTEAVNAGMGVVVLDHHGDSADVAPPKGVHIVNPNTTANKPIIAANPELEETKSMAAVGVSYMMAAEVMKRMKCKEDPKSLLSLVALGTVSDVVPMDTVLNRVLVREGLNVMRSGKDISMLRFMKGAGIEDPRAVSVACSSRMRLRVRKIRPLC